MRQKIYVLSKRENRKRIPYKIYENEKRAKYNLFLRSIFQRKKWSLKEVTIPHPASVVYIKRSKKKIYDKTLRMESYHINPIKHPTFTRKVIKDNPLRVLLYNPLVLFLIILLTVAYLANFFHFTQVINTCSILVSLSLMGMMIGELFYLLKRTDFVK